MIDKLMPAVLAALLLHAAGPAFAQEVLDPDPNTVAPSKDPRRATNGLAQTPPMQKP